MHSKFHQLSVNKSGNSLIWRGESSSQREDYTLISTFPLFAVTLCLPLSKYSVGVVGKNYFPVLGKGGVLNKEIDKAIN